MRCMELDRKNETCSSEGHAICTVHAGNSSACNVWSKASCLLTTPLNNPERGSLTNHHAHKEFPRHTNGPSAPFNDKCGNVLLQSYAMLGQLLQIQTSHMIVPQMGDATKVSS